MKLNLKIIAVSFFGLFLNQTMVGQALKSDTIDVIKYQINLDLVYLSKHEINGNTKLTIAPKINNLNKFGLDLLHLDIDSVLLNNSIITSWNHNDTLVSINLPQQANMGDTFTTTIFYHGIPVIDPSGWGGFYFSTDSLYAFNMGVGFDDSPHNYGRVWFPCIDDFHDRATYEFSIKTKTSNMAICNGTLDEIIDQGVFKTYKWSLKNTIPTYLANVAVGPYVLVADTFNGILGDIPIGIYVPTSKVGAAQASFINLKNILTNYESKFGPYRWERVGYVGVPFNSGAMEHSTNISLGLGYINGGLTYQSLIAHELAHQWFGNLVTTSSAPEMWINEGWAVFSEGITIEGLEGKEAYKNFIRDLNYNVMKNAHLNDGAYYPVSDVPHQVTYGTTVYDKGATIAHSIRGYLGDSLFFEMLSNYFEAYKFSHINTLEFRDFISQETGINMNDFFETWIQEPGFPHFSVDSFSVQPSGNKQLVTVFLRQKLHQKPNFSNSNRVWVEFGNDTWMSENHLATFSGEKASCSFLLDFVPSYCLIDPNEQLCDATSDFRKIINSTGTINFTEAQFTLTTNVLIDSSLFRITHNLVAPDTAGTNIPGLNISTRRYWDINGIIPTGSSFTGKFFYSRTNYDNDILLSASDSIVILYRHGAGSSWNGVPFTKTGSWSAGTITVPDLKKGQYAIGVWDAAHSGIKINQIGHPKILVYPNPSNKHAVIDGLPKGEYLASIVDMNGRIIEYHSVVVGNEKTEILFGNIPNGNYQIKIFDLDGNHVCTETIIIVK